MKKFTTFIICIFMLLLSFGSLFIGASTVLASSYEYFRVLEDGVYMYQDSLCTQKLFEVPKTYYVKAENQGQEFVRVSYGYESSGYPVIIGYMKTSELTLMETAPSKPYSIIKVSTALSDILFNDPELKNAYFNVPNNNFLTFYGYYNLENGTKLCYVYCNNKLGYIDYLSLNPFTVPDNLDPLPETNEPSTDTDATVTPTDPPSSLKGDALQIIIIVGISIVCISIVYTLFKPTKNKIYKREPTDFEDEE